MPSPTAPIGAVLAGGKSTRFGEPKLTANLNGKHLVEYPLQSMIVAGFETIIVAKPATEIPPNIAASTHVLREPGNPFHPFVGVLCALEYGKFQRPIIALACDMPCIPPKLLTALQEHPGDVVIPRVNSFLQPLCALYRPSATPFLKDALISQRSATATILMTTHTLLTEDALQDFGDPQQMFRDVDNPQQLLELTRVIS